MDLYVVELLCSRICHDLISPVSAVNNGVELVQEMGDEMGDEAMTLIGASASQAWRQLTLFRIAYGAGRKGQQMDGHELRREVDEYCKAKKMTTVWEDHTAGRTTLHKPLANLVLLAEETLPMGGELTITLTDTDVRITAKGNQATLSPDSEMALDAGVDISTLNPKTVQAYVTGAFIRDAGLSPKIEVVDSSALNLIAA